MPVAIKSITKKNLSKSKNLLGKEIKILKVRFDFLLYCICVREFFESESDDDSAAAAASSIDKALGEMEDLRTWVRNGSCCLS